MDPTWDFCPACGEDNRPPAQRKPVPHHFHRFVARSGHCWMCGEPANEPYAMSRKWRLRCSALCICAAVGMGTWAGLLKAFHASPVGPFGRWVMSWYENPIRHRGKYGRIYWTWQGDDLTLLLFMGAVPLLAFGLLLFFRVPMESSRNGGNELWQ